MSSQFIINSSKWINGNELIVSGTLLDAGFDQHLTFGYSGDNHNHMT